MGRMPWFSYTVQAWVGFFSEMPACEKCLLLFEKMIERVSLEIPQMLLL